MRQENYWKKWNSPITPWGAGVGLFWLIWLFWLIRLLIVVVIGGLGSWDWSPLTCCPWGAWAKEVGLGLILRGLGLIGLLGLLLVWNGFCGSELSSGIVMPCTPGAISLFGGLMYLLTLLLTLLIRLLLLTLVLTNGFWAEGVLEGVSKVPSVDFRIVDGFRFS